MLNKLLELQNEVGKLTSGEAKNNWAVYLAAGISMIGAMATGLSEGYATAKACEAIGRNPEAESKIRLTLIIGCGIAETSGIYGLIISLLLIFVVPNM